MTATAIEVYEIFKKHLEESDAKIIASFISEVKKTEINNVVDKKIENLDTKTELNKSVEKLDKTIENLATKAELAQAVKDLATKAQLERSASNTIKWMFIFWIGQLGGTIAFVLLFLK